MHTRDEHKIVPLDRVEKRLRQRARRHDSLDPFSVVVIATAARMPWHIERLGSAEAVPRGIEKLFQTLLRPHPQSEHKLVDEGFELVRLCLRRLDKGLERRKVLACKDKTVWYFFF